MGSKTDPGSYDCYANALPDEPMFVLLGRDPQAPALVARWADKREGEIRKGARPVSDLPMVAEARACAQQMRKWRNINDGKWKKSRKNTNAD